MYVSLSRGKLKEEKDRKLLQAAEREKSLSKEEENIEIFACLHEKEGTSCADPENFWGLER